MKRIVLLLITCLMFSVGYAQKIAKKLKEKYQEVELLEEYGYQFYKVLNNYKFGLLDNEGNEILPCQFESVSLTTIEVPDAKTLLFFANVMSNGKMAIRDLNDGGKEVFPPKYETARMCYEEDLNYYYVSVSNKDKYGICQIDGKEIISCNYDLAYISSVSKTKASYITVQKDGKFGLLQMTGEEIVPCNYEQAYIDYEPETEYYSVIVKKNGKYGICLENGEEKIPCIYDQAYIASEPESKVIYAKVKKGDKRGISNTDGKILVPCKYDNASLEYLKEANFYYVWVSNNDKRGLCTLDGKEIVPCICDYAVVNREENNGLLYIETKVNDKIGIVSINGDEIIPCEYDYIRMDYDKETGCNYYYARTYDHSTRHFNLSGELIFEEREKVYSSSNSSSKYSSSSKSSSKSSSQSGLSKLEKTALILQALTQGMQAMSGYMDTYSSRNIYSPPSSTSTSSKKTCSFCNGTGYNPGLERPAFYTSYDDPMTHRCDVCNDKSLHYHKQCPACLGRGYR